MISNATIHGVFEKHDRDIMHGRCDWFLIETERKVGNVTAESFVGNNALSLYSYSHWVAWKVAGAATVVPNRNP